ncbi:MAG: hypothetical protein LC808_30315, partial [Actinobacteria bacterium]|nr:hypothetical protein [Actinomycetota bacterium]
MSREAHAGICERRGVQLPPATQPDLRDFFTRLDHCWLVKFLEHRIADRRMLRLIGKWLKAGVIEDGIW